MYATASALISLKISGVRGTGEETGIPLLVAAIVGRGRGRGADALSRADEPFSRRASRVGLSTLRAARRIPRTLASSRFRPPFKPFGALGSYRLIYEVTTERIFILGLVHGARDLVALWPREKRTGETQP